MTAASAPTPTAPRNGLGTAALGLGAFSIPLLVLLGPGLLAGIVAIVLGLFALRRVRNGEATNRRSARAGIALGAVGILLFAGLQAYGFYYTRGPAGERYQDCVRQVADGSREARTQAFQVCAERLAQERERAG